MTREDIAERLHVSGCMHGEGVEGCTFDRCMIPTRLTARDFWLRLADEVIRMDAEREAPFRGLEGEFVCDGCERKFSRSEHGPAFHVGALARSGYEHALCRECSYICSRPQFVKLVRSVVERFTTGRHSEQRP